MPFFDRQGVQFHYVEYGEGVPFVFQHGLGGDHQQPTGLYRPPPGVRLLAFDMRAHGETRPVGDYELLTIPAFADDLIALLDHLGIDRAVIGGISLGAAVAANAALRHAERLLGMVLSRPAWIDGPLPGNVALYSEIARLMRELGARKGRERFRESSLFASVAAESPDCAGSLLGQFEAPSAEECVARLERLPKSTPCRDRTEYGTIAIPTLILGNLQDPIHPWPFAEELARLVPGAQLQQLTPKSTDAGAHAADVQAAIDGFLTRHFL